MWSDADEINEKVTRARFSFFFSRIGGALDVSRTSENIEEESFRLERNRILEQRSTNKSLAKWSVECDGKRKSSSYGARLVAFPHGVVSTMFDVGPYIADRMQPGGGSISDYVFARFDG